MQTFRVPRSSSDLPHQVHTLRSNADSILRKFGTQKILEKKLSTKTFNYEFDLTGLRSGGQRKSVQKLRDIISKAVKKQIPYLEYTMDELLQNSTAQNAVKIMVTSPWITVTKSRADAIAAMVDNLKYTKTLKRYTKYLRHKCIKYGIPLDFNVRNSVEIHPDDLERHDRWQHGPVSVDTCTFKLRVRFVITPSLCSYSYNSYLHLLRDVESGLAPDLKDIDSYYKYESYLLSNGSPESIKAYKDEENWTSNELVTRGREQYYKGAEKYASPEKLFLILDQIQQVVKTLSRKTSYDTEAFNIGSGEAS